MNRQPLVNRALILAGLAVAYAALKRAGVDVPPDLREPIETFALIAAPLALAWWTHRHTTPTKDPRTADGTPLVPAETAGQAQSGGASADDVPPVAIEPAA